MLKPVQIVFVWLSLSASTFGSFHSEEPINTYAAFCVGRTDLYRDLS